MREEKQAIVDRVVEDVWNRGNLDAINDLLTPEFVSRDPSGAEVRGPQGFKQYVATYRSAFPDLHFTIEDSITMGQEVTVYWRATGAQPDGKAGIPGNGRSWPLAGTTIYRFADGKIVESWVHWNTLGIMQFSNLRRAADGH